MAKIIFKGQSVETLAGETLLAALIRGNLKPPHSCTMGICHICMLKSENSSDDLKPAQNGLSHKEISANMFLACQHHPKGDMKVALPTSDHHKSDVIIAALKPLSETIMRVELSPQRPLSYKAGQYLKLWQDEQTQRCYSIASLSNTDPHLHLHVQRIAGGKFSTWLFKQARCGDRLQVSDIQGDCHYKVEYHADELVLIGSGTGLAPLFGLLKDALHQQHRKSIHLYHRGSQSSELYLDSQLRELAAQHSNFYYHPIIASTSADGPESLIKQTFELETKENVQYFLCGSESLLKRLKLSLLSKGIKPALLHFDVFAASGQ